MRPGSPQCARNQQWRLIIRRSGRSLPAAGRVNLTTVGTVIGQGAPLTLAPGKVLRACNMDIARNVLWKNTGDITLGETMRGVLTIASRFTAADRNPTTGDVRIGAGDKVRGSLGVTGYF